MYTRKTKDIYILFWQGEEIDETESRSDALYLKKEYALAYGEAVTIKKRRVKK